MSVNKAANLRSQYEDLCRELNMDRETEDMSWKMFEEVLQRSTLEVPNHGSKLEKVSLFHNYFVNRANLYIGFVVRSMLPADYLTHLQWVNLMQ